MAKLERILERNLQRLKPGPKPKIKGVKYGVPRIHPRIQSKSHFLRAKRGEKRILIVDDNEATRKEIRGVVENLDYSTLEARSGSEALNMVNKEMPDLIILDIILPDFDGFKILCQLKRNLRTKHIPVILLSAIEKPEEKAKGLILGASDFITKPFSPLEFSARVEMLLERTEEGYGAA